VLEATTTGSPSVAFWFLIFGVILFGSGAMSLLVAAMRRQAAESMDVNPLDTGYGARLKLNFVKSSMSPVLYYMAAVQFGMGLLLVIASGIEKLLN
jgi:Mn2+/Fe2+ NRAMP family transporter